LKTGTELGRFETRRGGRYAIAREPTSGAYLRLSGEAGALAAHLDGHRTTVDLETLAAGWEAASVGRLLTSFEAAGLLDPGPSDDPASPAVDPPASRSPRPLGAVLRPLVPTLRLPRADAVAGAAHRRAGRLVFSRSAAVLIPPFLVAGLIAFLAVWRDDGRAVGVHRSTGSTAAVIALAVLGKVLHELGHALAVKRAGREVIDAGIHLYLGLPAFYVDSTDLLLAPRRARIVNALAGPVAEAVVAATASLVVAVWSDGLVAAVAFPFAAISWASVLLNLVPFLELDGYWLLTDVLDRPRLRARSFDVLRHELPRRLQRRRAAMTGEERALVAFGAVSALATAAAIVAAAILWWLIADGAVTALWGAGAPGRGALGLLAAVIAAPVLSALADAAGAVPFHKHNRPHRPRRRQPWQTSP
jgi:putative peptide zinc metalloprotease protein